MELAIQQRQLGLKNKCVEFMFAYQQKNVAKMLSCCTPDATIEFLPLGPGGKGKVSELGKQIWTGLIDSFPDLDNTVDAAIAEDNDVVRCQVVIRGTQKKDFADIKSYGKHFESDHIFIFRLTDNDLIEHITVEWNHDNLKEQLGN